RPANDPAARFPNCIAISGCAVGSAILWIQVNRLLQESQRLGYAFRRLPIETFCPTQEIVVGIEALSWCAFGPRRLCLLHLRRDGTNYARGNVVLQVKDVLQLAIKAIRPQVRSRRGINELRCYPNSIGRFAHAALKDIPDAQITTHVLYVHSLVLVDKTRVAGDHE